MIGLISVCDPGASAGDVDVGPGEKCKAVAAVGVFASEDPKTDSSCDTKETGTTDTGTCVPEEANSDDSSEINDGVTAGTAGMSVAELGLLKVSRPGII